MWSWDYAYNLAWLLQPLGRAYPYSSCKIFHNFLDSITRAGHETSGLIGKLLVELRITVKSGQGIFLSIGMGFVQGRSLGLELVLMQNQKELTHVWLFWSCLSCDFQNIGVWIPNIILLYKHYSPFLWLTICHLHSELLYTNDHMY